ncbi:MAG: deoxyribodipyrimidine photolyase [Deltaproteobacteria bacterium]|nr:deoxyribodipyrimidine photolyase [Deltaproteobacteria bacterium]
MFNVPDYRLRTLNNLPINKNGNFILYWMIANRRVQWNFSLDSAIMWAQQLEKPLIILEALRSGQKWACDRFHNFIIDGMKDNREALEDTGVFYYPYIEPYPDAGKGLLKELSKRACIIVADFFPSFFLPKMIAAASSQVMCRMDQIDSNGLLPLFKTNQVFASAFSFRRHLQNELPKYILEAPSSAPLVYRKLRPLEKIPEDILKQWPPIDAAFLDPSNRDLSRLSIDHKVWVVSKRGGSIAAAKALDTFINERLSGYASGRNHPDIAATSGLSAYLHWGHISAHQIFWNVMNSENWTPDRLSTKTDGKKSGWWGTSENVEAFLDELITWRELGYNMCSLRNDYDTYESLPEWALQTLSKHENDTREYIYEIDVLERAKTHDRIWNAAQNELLITGFIHNYLRMLWGKKILEWTASPRHALEIMIELNNKYALDGRDPNSYSGIFWILGRYDRPWGPERSIFGKIRYMSSKRTLEKLKMERYLKTYLPD